MEREDTEEPIPLDDGPVEDEVLDDMHGDENKFTLSYFSCPDSATKGKTGLQFANATSRDVYIKVHKTFHNVRKTEFDKIFINMENVNF